MLCFFNFQIPQFMRILILFTSLFFLSLVSNAQDKCLNHVVGKVTNIDNPSEHIAHAKLTLVHKGELIETVYSNAKGEFSFSNLECEARYRVVCVIENFAKSVKLIFTGTKTNHSHDVHLKLVPIAEFVTANEVKRIVTKNITFYPDSYDLTPEAVSELEWIRKVLMKYEKVNIEIAFHTDSRGGAKFLKELSQERADVCRNYLAAHDIDGARIIAKGYGATKLLNDCGKGANCSQSQHLINRRSEFIVTSNKKAEERIVVE